MSSIMKPVSKSFAHSVYDEIDHPEEFINWLNAKWSKLSDAEKLSARMHVGRGTRVTMIGFTYIENVPREIGSSTLSSQDGGRP